MGFDPVWIRTNGRNDENRLWVQMLPILSVEYVLHRIGTGNLAHLSSLGHTLGGSGFGHCQFEAFGQCCYLVGRIVQRCIRLCHEQQ